MRLKLKLLMLSALAVTSWLGVSAQTFKTLTKSQLHEITYGWPITDTNPTKTGHLDDVVKIPQQGDEGFTKNAQDDAIAHAIALIREVYVNPDVPGTIHRGWDYQYNSGLYGQIMQSGSQSNTNNAYGGVNGGLVNYQAVGQCNSSSQTEDYGWNITTNKVIQENYPAYYFDRYEFRPKDEGYTLLFIEVRDKYEPSYKEIRSYGDLVEYFRDAIKSVRVVPNSIRLHEGQNTSGTLFKINTGSDKINRFFMMSKGQCRYQYNVNSNSSSYRFYPYYNYSNRVYVDRESGQTGNKSYDNLMAPFYHMFEQYSPSTSGDGGTVASDLLQKINSGESLGVIHDCLSVLTAGGNGHYFQMIGGTISEAQTVNDLMFFIPDKRLLYHSDRDSRQQFYVDYHTSYKPDVLKYAIHLVATPEQVDGKDVYKIHLDWTDNNFAAVTKDDATQVSWLYRVIYSNDGSYTYERVKKLTGDVTDGQHSAEDLDQILNDCTYDDYIPMLKSGQEVIYVVQCSDLGTEEEPSFLDLQFSNHATCLIPGTDKQERLRLGIGAVAQSNYDPATHKNYYSNVIPMHNGLGTSVNRTFLSDGTDGTVFTLYRKSAKGAETGDVVARARVNRIYNNNVEFVVTMENQDNHGYKVTDGTITCPIATDVKPDGTGNTIQVGEIDFSNFVIRDNFSVTPNNEGEHLGAYYYQVSFKSAVGFDGFEEGTLVYSNEKDILVYKTQMNSYGTYEKVEVDDDVEFADEPSMPVKYEVLVQQASDVDLYQYRVQRWNEPMAQRTLNTPVATATNSTTYYTISSPATPADATLPIETGRKKMAQFKETNDAVGVYDYVPVVETFVPESKYREQARNTYGAPINPIAIGKLNVSVMVPNETDLEHAMMSNYKWQNDGIWYSYYNFLLNIDNLDIPDGYQLYKLRAWRKVEGYAKEGDQDPLEGSILGECLSTRAPRTTTFKKTGEGLDESYLGDWYLYEDITFGDQMYENDTEGNLMSIDFFKVYPNYLLGDRSTKIGPVFEPEPGEWTSGDNHGIQEDAIRNEKRATFGAQRLMTKTGDDKQDVGTLEKMKVSFIVRAYFTKEKESQPNNAPRRAATLNSLDGKYYIAEGKADYTVAKTNGIITAVTSIDANREVSGVMYYNAMGLPSVTPWQGVNIVVTRYTDGTTSTTKVIK